jgi:hypothetical protein
MAPRVDKGGGECCRLIILIIVGAVKWFFHHGGRGKVSAGGAGMKDSRDSKP